MEDKSPDESFQDLKNDRKNERQNESNEYFNSKSPPVKKQKLSSFEDGSDDELIDATLVISGEDIYSSSEDENSENNNIKTNNSLNNKTNIKTNLKHPDLDDKRVRTLLQCLFNDKIIEDSLNQMGIPIKSEDKYSFISNDILNNIKSILNSIHEFFSSDPSERDGKELLKLSYDYYCLLPTIAPIPHYISSSLELYNKYQIYNFLKTIHEYNTKKSLVEKYISLGCKISSVSRSSDIFKQILQSIGSTNYPRIPCVIKDIYSIENKNNDFKIIEPRMLLWYGNVLSLIPNILSNSLQLSVINNPKFPCGNAIYLSDMFSESVKQAKSFTIEDNPNCIVLLCEVSVGQISSIRHKEKFDAPPDGSNSVKCVGRSYYDTRNTLKTSDGLELVSGKIIPNGIYGTEWEFNKYAIFDPKQIRIRYIVHVELTAANISEKVANPINLPFGNIVAKGIWKYASGKRWILYDNELSHRIEENYQRNQKIIHLTIAGVNYTINLDHMIQYQTQNPKKSRKIRRE